MAEQVGLIGLGVYVPPQIVTAEMLAAETGIAAAVLREKFGVRQVHRAGDDCHISDMSVGAAQAALADAGIGPDEVDLLVYCGSEYKDHIVWSAATHITDRLGCSQAEAFEVYALCAGMPVALRTVKDMMVAEPTIRTALVVAASKESALVDRSRSHTRFMFNFGDGASAGVLQRGGDRNLVLGSSSIVDGSLSKATVMAAGGSRQPASEESVREGRHYLDVPDLEGMRTRLDEVSGDNFLRVVRTALERSGYDRADFLAAVHMKRSMQEWLMDTLGVDRSFYLEDYGHMQAADQLTALVEARERDLLRAGDAVVLVAAGVGYTWSATVVRWG